MKGEPTRIGEWPLDPCSYEPDAAVMGWRRLLPSSWRAPAKPWHTTSSDLLSNRLGDNSAADTDGKSIRSKAAEDPRADLLNLDRVFSNYTSDERVLLDRLPADGSGLTNPRLKEMLHWGDNRYYTARDALLDAGLVVLGRGRGGVVRRAPAVERPRTVAPRDAELEQLDRVVAGRERELYEPMRRVIAGERAKDKRFDPLAVEVTAQQGRRETGGRYTRPDIVAIEMRSFRYLPGKTLELITFEVKASYALDVTCVYEALAHRSAATHSYVLLHVPDPEASQSGVDVIEQAAREHGVGLIVVEDPGSFASWDTRVDARRIEPDPRRLDEFIQTQLSERTKELVQRRR